MKYCFGEKFGYVQNPDDRVRNAHFWVITQRVVAISYRRFWTTYRYHLQGVENLNPNPLDFVWILYP